MNSEPAIQTQKIKHNIGPNQLKSQLETLKKAIPPHEQWKNVPVPVCRTSEICIASIDLLKKFSLFIESRFQNVVTSNSIAQEDMVNKFSAFNSSFDDTWAEFNAELQ